MDGAKFAAMTAAQHPRREAAVMVNAVVMIAIAKIASVCEKYTDKTNGPAAVAGLDPAAGNHGA